MSRDQKKSPTAKSLRRTELQVERVTGLLRSVLLKFPANTLHPSLVPFTRQDTWSFRLSSTDKGEVVLTGSRGFRELSTARFPAALLDAQDSDVTKWARAQYWGQIQYSKQRLREEATETAKRAKRALEAAQRHYEQTAKAAEAACAPTGKQRRAREKQFPPAE